MLPIPEATFENQYTLPVTGYVPNYMRTLPQTRDNT